MLSCNMCKFASRFFWFFGAATAVALARSFEGRDFQFAIPKKNNLNDDIDDSMVFIAAEAA